MLIANIILALLFAISHLSVTNALSTGRRDSTAHLVSSPLQANHGPRPNLHSTPIKLPNSPSFRLNPRTIGAIQLADHWILALESYQSFIPSAPAIPFMADFYQALEANAAILTHQATELPRLIVNSGGMNLQFRCLFGGIPWSLIYHFATFMRAMTDRGFAGFYRARAIHQSGIVVFITLYVAPDMGGGAAAP